LEVLDERPPHDGTCGPIFGTSAFLERSAEFDRDRCGNARHRAAPIGSAVTAAPNALTPSRRRSRPWCDRRLQEGFWSPTGDYVFILIPLALLWTLIASIVLVRSAPTSIEQPGGSATPTV
jgi:hypothetical protein